MSCWRVLTLPDHATNEQFPQLLVKPHFERDAYTVYITDLSNIWSEELGLSDIVDRASTQESPIEVSKQDSTQLGILLENVKKSLVESDDTSCRMTRTNTSDDGLVLYTTITLPEPLDSLCWKFCLRKRSSVVLKNELILPLIVSSHIQHERINGLIQMITEKDRVITRLVDRFESSNLDLAVAFPSIGGLKKGGRTVRKEQAAKHVPGLLAFEKSKWRRGTAELRDGEISTMGLFRETLEECTPKVPPRLKSNDNGDMWWGNMDLMLENAKGAPKFNSKAAPKKADPPKPDTADSETETEDEFETHENFKLRGIVKPSTHAPVPASPSTTKPNTIHEDGTTDDEDDDLDAPPKSQSQSRQPQATSKLKSPTPELGSSPQEGLSTVPKMKAKGFRIGGRKNSKTPPPESKEASEEELPTRAKADSNETSTASKPMRRSFKIGGKAKATTDSGVNGPTPSLSDAVASEKATSKATVLEAKEEDAVMTGIEETSEEKAERKRRELKRKNEELVKKQAAAKKKKRF